MKLITYRVCSAVRFWNDRMKCFVNQISYIENYSSCEIDKSKYRGSYGLYDKDIYKYINDGKYTIERKECIQ